MKNLVLILLTLLGSARCLSQTPDYPSIIIIMADQLRFDVLGELTPNIEGLRRDGVEFNSVYCASPICVPSRASFFTGLSPNRHGSLINGWQDEDAVYSKVKAGVPNLYQILEQKWDSHHVGKQHLFTSDVVDGLQSRTKWVTQKEYTEWAKKKGVEKPGGKQFKGMVPEMISGERTHTREYSIPVVARYSPGIENFLDHYIANQSIKAIHERDKDKPLLLNAMFLAPHPPFHIPEPYYSMMNGEDVHVPDNVGVWYEGQSPLQLYNITGFVGSRYNREQWGEVWRKYLGLVKLLDDEVGRVIESLKAEGLYDNSIIIFTSDHGEMLGSHSLWQKMCMYEESVRVPLIIKFPASYATKMKSIDHSVSLVDVFPTLLDYVSVKAPIQVDGRSLLPLVQGVAAAHSPVFIQYDGNGSLGNFQRCVVQGDFKLIVDIFKNETFLELYNVARDPQEKVNLAFKQEYAGTVDALLTTLAVHMRTTGDRLTLPGDLRSEFISRYKKNAD